MSRLPLHLEYRPKTLNEFFGNESVVTSVRSILERTEGQPRSWFFYGPSGCGKTTLARIIKNELKCADKDFYEYNSANLRGIDTIREIADSFQFMPLFGSIRIYLLDEMHQLTGVAAPGLLKLLEDTPEHVRFILCTTEPEKVLNTIRNRCVSYELMKLQKVKMLKLLISVCGKEKIKITESFSTVLKEIVKSAEGSPRKALVLLDQVVDIGDDEDALKAIENSRFDRTTTIDLCRGLIDGKWKEVSAILKGLDKEPESARYAILGYLEKVLLNTPSERIADLIILFSEPYFYTGRAGLTLSCYLGCKKDKKF